jgi:N-acetylglucosamine malate deacetylase 2
MDGPLEVLLERTLVVAAHPDDESVGCGALLQRMASKQVVFMTDGAPRDGYFWKQYGSRDTYARLREREAHAALAHVGVAEVSFLGAESGIIDQELYRNLPRALDALHGLAHAWKPAALLALAYEGGHPDHDSCNVLASVIAREFELPVWEMPLYHRSVEGEGVLQDFVSRNGTEVHLEITPEELQCKHACIKAYASQGDILRHFNAPREIFRPLAAYDYSRPAHDGQLNYEKWGWPIRGTDVSAAFAEFLGKGVAR